MVLTLKVDLVNGEVLVRRRAKLVWRYRSAQWVEFYARLVLARDAGEPWVTCAHVSELQAWKSMQRVNVGKAVARHLTTSKAKAACVLETEHPTLRWRLKSKAAVAVEIESTDPTLEQSLRQRGMGSIRSAFSIEWLRSMVGSLMAFGRGRLIEAENQAWAALRTPGLDQDCRRLSGMMVLRAAAGRNRAVLVRGTVEQMIDGDAANLEISDRHRWGHGALGDYLRARLRVIEAVDSGKDEALNHIAPLKRMLEKAEFGGNLASQIVLTNAMGLLAQRISHHDDSQHYLNQCIIFCLATGDLFTLGGAIFNLALAVLNGRADVGQARELVELCVAMDKAAGVGRSSAQAEILLARLHIHECNLQLAEEIMEEADAMVSANSSPYDQGCLKVAQAKLIWGKVVREQLPKTVAEKEIRRLLNDASDLFRASGRGSDYVDAQIRELSKGQGLSLSCLN